MKNKYLFEIAVIAVIRRHEDNKFLVLKRSKKDQQEGIWEFPGGKLEHGETLMEGLTREISEETGLEVSLEDKPFDVHTAGHSYSALLSYFAADFVRGDVVISSAEHSDYRWVTLAEFAGMKRWEADVGVLKRWNGLGK